MRQLRNHGLHIGDGGRRTDDQNAVKVFQPSATGDVANVGYLLGRLVVPAHVGLDARLDVAHALAVGPTTAGVCFTFGTWAAGLGCALVGSKPPVIAGADAAPDRVEAPVQSDCFPLGGRERPFQTVYVLRDVQNNTWLLFQQYMERCRFGLLREMPEVRHVMLKGVIVDC